MNVDEYSELAGEIQLLWDKVVVSMWTSSGTKVGCVNVDEYSELAGGCVNVDKFRDKGWLCECG